MRVALGFTPHSGWAAAVAVTAGTGDPVVLARRRLLLSDRELPCQPFHEAAGLDPSAAAEVVAEATRTAVELAEREIDRLVEDLDDMTAAGVAAGTRREIPAGTAADRDRAARGSGNTHPADIPAAGAVAGGSAGEDPVEIAAAGIVAAGGTVREDLPLAEILVAHGRLHTAEGELYRDVLLDALTARGIPVRLLPAREAAAAGQDLLGPARLTALGRPHGPPWTRDHKDAVAAALVAAG